MNSTKKLRRYSIYLLMGGALVVLAVFNNCGKGFQSIGNGNNSASQLVDSNGSVPSLSGNDVMLMQVGGTTQCDSDSYVNEPCTSITICSPNSSSCQTINNILVDTGSYGLRIFSSVLTVALTPENNSSGQPIAECAQFGTGSDWGPVEMASVILGQEPAVQVPVQVINANYASVPSVCGTPGTATGPDTNPSSAGFNGILGVGLFAQDCGSDCTTDTNNQTYYTCSGSGSKASCSIITVSLAEQVTNPVAELPTDNNGVALVLPTVAFGGANSTSGYLLLGIGTQVNNTPVGTSTLTADSTYGEFMTEFAGQSMSGFIDSGSNGYFIPATSNDPDCTDSNYSGWLCPTSSYTSTASATGMNGTTSSFQYQVANAVTLFGYNEFALMNLAGDSSGGQGSYGDLGLPFFYGKTVYVGIKNTNSSVGTGPYWAF